MTYIRYQTNFVFDMIRRMWCMMFHRHNWEPLNNTMDKCPICGEEWDNY